MKIEPNSIYCGDCYELIKDIPDQSVQCIYTDVPYLYQMGGGGTSDVAKRIRANADRLNIAKIDKGFDYAIFNEFVRIQPKINLFIWCSKLQLFDIANWWLNWAKQNDRQIFYEILTWCKCLGGTAKIWCRNYKNEVSKMMLKDLARLNLKTVPVEVFNGKKWTKIHNIVKSSHYDTYLITLRNGNSFYASSEHQFPINNNLIQTKDLKIGDILDHIQLELGNKFSETVISKDVPWFIGYFIANGSYTRNKIQISTNQDKDFVKQRLNKLCNQYGAYYYVFDEKQGKSRSINISSPVLKGFLEEYIIGKLAYGKHCSRKVWDMPKWFIEELFQGYLDGDGYKENEHSYRIGFTRKNYELQSDLLTICNILGYKIKMQKSYTNIGEKKYAIWRGRIELNKSSTCKSDYEITNIKKIKHKMDLYDIQLQSEDHLFALADGTLTHNCNPTPATNNTWLPDTEYCLYFRESGIKLNDGYEHKHKWYLSGLNVEDKNNYGHPTCKPLEFVEHNLAHVCQPGDTVFDPFLGSGTTSIAAKHLGLKYIGFEINEEYFKIAQDRLSGWNQKGEMNLFDFYDSENN